MKEPILVAGQLQMIFPIRGEQSHSRFGEHAVPSGQARGGGSLNIVIERQASFYFLQVNYGPEVPRPWWTMSRAQGSSDGPAWLL